MKCECYDSGCAAPNHRTQRCQSAAITVLYRIDMDDVTGTRFCDGCAEDAMESGLFTDERPRPGRRGRDEYGQFTKR